MYSVTRCVDCTRDGITTARPIVEGILKPRCATHARGARKERAAKAHDARVQREFGLAPGEYADRYAGQGGACAICQRARGLSGRRLAVDHCHACTQVRGLLCQPCNFELIGKNDVAALRRAIEYLEAHSC